MSNVIKTPAGDVTHEYTVEQVKSLFADLMLRRGGNLRDAVQGLRTEVHEALQAQCPMPPESAVTDAHRIQSDKDRKIDPLHSDAFHWLQKAHGKALWAEADRLIAAANLDMKTGGAS